MGCGKNSHTIVAGVSSNSIIEKINSYRSKGVVCADKQYIATHELISVDVAKSINSDTYTFDKYDYDTVLTISKDENLSKLFNEPLNCDYLFGEFTDVVSYDEPTLFLGGNVDEEQ